MSRGECDGLRCTIAWSLVYYKYMKHLAGKTFRLWIGRSVLIMFGCMLTLGLLEVVFTIFAYQKTQEGLIALTPADTPKYRILALGESTTATLRGPAWPEYLEQLLNQHAGTEKFRVINAGVSGTTTKEVSARIDDYISLYNPHMVISMLGINDVSYPDADIFASTKYEIVRDAIVQSRVYRFISILKRQLLGRQSKELLQRAIHCTDASMGETAFQRLDTEGNETRESRLLTYISTYPFSFHGYELIVDYYARNNRWTDVLEWIDTAQLMDPFIRLCVMQSTTKEEDRLHELTRHINTMMHYIGTMEKIAQHAQTQTRGIDASWYKQFGSLFRTQPSDTGTYYPAIARRLYEKNIVHIAMQYPMLSLGELQKTLGAIDDIVYVSNEENFQKALQTHSYDEIFVDHFTGVFGHTTALGSKIIAESLVSMVLRIAQKEAL